MKSFISSIDKYSSKQKDIFVFICFFLLIALVYGKTIFFKYCIDDQYYLWLFVEEGSSLKNHFQSLLQRFWGAEYRPVTYITILFESLLFGERPEIHHFFNLIYYLVLCFSIYKVLSKYFQKHEEQFFYISFCIALLFLIHPAHSNVVSSIKNRETILSLLFGVYALYVWLLYIDRRKLYLMFLSAFLIIVGTYAKRDILPFFVVVPICGWLYAEKENYKKLVLPLLIMLFCIVIGTWFVQNFIAVEAGSEFAMHAYENALLTMDISFMERIPYAFYLLGMYEKFMVWPFQYYFYFGYDVLPVVTTWESYIVLLAIIHVFFVAFLIYLYRKGNKYYLIGPVIFYLSIAPFVLSLVTGYMAVRYSFIASFGFCIAVVQIAFFIATKITSKSFDIIYALSVVLLMIFFSYQAYNRSSDWRDIDTLYSTDIPKIERSANANRMACMYYYIVAADSDISEHEQLILKSHSYCDQALTIYEISEAILYKAMGYELLNLDAKALPLYERLYSINNNSKSAREFLAYHYKNIGEVNQAIDFFEQLIEVDAHNKKAYIELTQLYNNRLRFDEAIDLNRKFYGLEYHYDALLNFGDIFIASGDTSSALKNYNTAILYQKEDYIIDAVLEISRQFGNDTMIMKLEQLLETN